MTRKIREGDRPIEDRFWERVQVGAEDDCWIWTRGRTKYGYGVISINHKMVLAHRLIASNFNVATLTFWDVVCHSCDNPPCVNPKHLIVATHAFNTADSRSKGRLIQSNPSIGERSPHAKLTEEQVKFIRTTGESGASLARRFNVTDALISAIRKRKIWKHVA